MEVDEGECTKKAFIIKYCSNIEEISLFESELKENALNFYYFEEKQEKAKGSDNVKEKIKELNKKNNIIFEYYIVKTPIEAFDDLNLSEEIKNYVQFIDLPGFDVSGYYDIINSEKIFNFMDGIII